jgi:bifunctional UDP-N-acetylglucosamine pyrophosphorylase/glucosamine-1-phosphate N-acetyltransferase
MRETKAIILAAGKSTRMKSELPKVLHDVCGRPMLAYVIDSCRQVGIQSMILVVGHRQDLVKKTFAGEAGLAWVTQEPQLGTGHAVMVCREALAGFTGDVVILYGDAPCIKVSTLELLLKHHGETNAAVTMLTAIMDYPVAFGRIIRDKAGKLQGIVEHKDCTAAQAAIQEINPGFYCFRAPDLLWALDRITNDNAKGEYYLTDTLALLIQDGRRAEAIPGAAAEEVMAANSRAELVEVTRIIHDRILRAHLENGVTIVDPGSTFIDSRASIGQDTVVRPFSVVEGNVRIGRKCTIGPFTHLLDGAVVEDETAVGSFVEIRGRQASGNAAGRKRRKRTVKG